MKYNPIGMILSAGYGTRLYPLTESRPKPIMEIAGQPIIYFLIKMLEDAGIKDIIINLHYHPNQIKKVLDKLATRSRIHLVYEREILGTAGGIANALQLLNIKNRQLVLIHGDIFCPIDLNKFLDTKEFCTLICVKNREVQGYQGSVAVNQQGNICELGCFFRKNGSVTARGFFTGIHILSPSSVELIKQTKRQSLVAEVYPDWLKEGRNLFGLILPLFYEDLGSIDRLFHANMAVFKEPKLFGLRESETSSIYQNGDVKINKTAQLKGPLLLGSSVVIEENALVGPNVIVGEGVRIKAHATIKKSVLMSYAVVEKNETINNAIVLDATRVLVKG